MRTMHGMIGVLAIGLWMPALGADYDLERWDDSARTNHNWKYYDTDAPAPHDVDMTWSAGGGVAGSGYVRTPLNLLDTAHHNEAYWPAYLYRDIGVNQEIDLTIPGAQVRVYAGDVSMAAPMDLGGGQLHFFIGQYLQNGPGDADDTWSFFYNLTPAVINPIGWTTESVIPVGTDADWGVIADNDPSVNPGDLFWHPEQWGFVVFPAAEMPTGVLGLDSWRIVPEPATLALLALGACGLVARRRRRARP